MKPGTASRLPARKGADSISLNVWMNARRREINLFPGCRRTARREQANSRRWLTPAAAPLADQSGTLAWLAHSPLESRR